MPHVVGTRVAKYRGDPHTSPAEPLGQVVVFATPADKMFVEAVNPLKITPPDGDVAADELRSHAMADRLVQLVFDPALEDSQAFPLRDPHAIRTGCDGRLVDTLGYVIRQAAGNRPTRPRPIAGRGGGAANDWPGKCNRRRKTAGTVPSWRGPLRCDTVPNESRCARGS